MIADWFARFEYCMATIYPNDLDARAHLVRHLPNLLVADALTVYKALPDHVKVNYDATKIELISVFNNDDYIRVFRDNLTARPRKSNESIDVYLSCLRNDTILAFPTYDNEQISAEVLRRFTAGLSPYLRGKCYEFDVHTILEALHVVKNVERAEPHYSQVQSQLSSFPPMATIAPVISEQAQFNSKSKSEHETLGTDSVLKEVLGALKQLQVSIDHNNDSRDSRRTQFRRRDTSSSSSKPDYGNYRRDTSRSTERRSFSGDRTPRARSFSNSRDFSRDRSHSYRGQGDYAQSRSREGESQDRNRPRNEPFYRSNSPHPKTYHKYNSHYNRPARQNSVSPGRRSVSFDDKVNHVSKN